MLVYKIGEGYEFSNLTELILGRCLNSGLLKICDRISLLEFSICVSEVGSICKEGGNRVFERSFSEVWIKRNYRLFDDGAVMSLLLR